MAVCPLDGNLMLPSALDAMLQARSSHNQHLVLLTAGYVSGSAAIPMHNDAIKFARQQVDTLDSFGLQDYLILSSDFPPHLRPRGAPANAGQFCQNQLRPLSLCCAWSSYGFDALSGTINATSRGWPAMTVYHPWMLLLQRVWLIAESTSRGYHVLSTDTDLHFSVSPAEIFAPWRWKGVGLLFQGDSGFPHRETRAERELRMQQAADATSEVEQLPRDVPVPCELTTSPSSSSGGEAHNTPPCACSSSARSDLDAPPPNKHEQGHAKPAGHLQPHSHPHSQPHSEPYPQPTVPPIVNVGLIHARGLPAVANLFRWAATTIRERLSNDVPPELRDASGVVLDFAVWEQDVLNEVRAAIIPQLSFRSYHPRPGLYQRPHTTSSQRDRP